MTPSLAGQDQLNALLNDAILARQFTLRDAAKRITAANLSHIAISQFGPAVFLATLVLDSPSVRSSPFGEQVTHIIQTCTDKDVVGANTRRIVARMTSEHTFGKGLIVSDFPRHVGHQNVVPVSLNSAVSATVLTCPDPTTIRLLNVRPEECNDVLNGRDSLVVADNEASSTFCQFATAAVA